MTLVLYIYSGKNSIPMANVVTVLFVFTSASSFILILSPDNSSLFVQAKEGKGEKKTHTPDNLTHFLLLYLLLWEYG